MTDTNEIRAKTNPELLTSAGQTYLVGETVYVRPLVPADAEFATSWRDTVFPQAPERVRRWIDDELAGSSGSTLHLVVRKDDDRPVGSVQVFYDWFPHHEARVYIDPIHGAQGVAWKAETLAMMMPLVVDDQQRPKVNVHVPAREAPVIAALEAIGARQVTRFREKVSMPGGGRDDELIYEYFNSDWVRRLGDPTEASLPRTGTGVARPVTPPVQPDGDPPANAVRVGPRVYLRPPQDSDASALAHWSTREIDTSWDNGRDPFSLGGATRWMKGSQKHTPPGTIDLAVCLRETDELIGVVGLLQLDYRHRVGESASMIVNPAYRAAGYGSEAKHLLFDYAFNTLGLHALQSYVMFENTRSAAALRKQGYREAGRKCWLTPRDGTFVSFATFDLLASEWRAMPRRGPGAPE
jgi:RimJ/RimL family protein N-acetyltransferase